MKAIPMILLAYLFVRRVLGSIFFDVEGWDSDAFLALNSFSLQRQEERNLTGLGSVNTQHRFAHSMKTLITSCSPSLILQLNSQNPKKKKRDHKIHTLITMFRCKEENEKESFSSVGYCLIKSTKHLSNSLEII